MKSQRGKFDYAKDKVSKADPGELQRFRQSVREQVVKPIQKRATEQKKAVAKARARYVR
jgi:hypothetical protein